MYNHYIALDWAKSNMALARTTLNSDKVSTYEGASSLSDIKMYLKQLKGEKILTLEETTSSQWLYSELKPHVEKLIVCDPHRNRLLSDGPKNDKIDAQKLVCLLKSNMLKEVYHSGEEFIYLRKLMSGYEDVVKSGVRLKNQRSALFSAEGLNAKKEDYSSVHGAGVFVLKEIEEQLKLNAEIKGQYEKEFKRLATKHKEIALLKSLPGIGNIHAIRIVASVVNISRFKSKGHFLSYCGLIKHEKISGGMSYGRRSPRYYRPLKQVFKMASHVVINMSKDNYFKQVYDYSIMEKNKPVQKARHDVARKLAVSVYGMLKTKKRFVEPNFIGGKKVIKDKK